MTLRSFVGLLIAYTARVSASNYAFVGIGDWGGASLNAQYASNTNQVAVSMSNYSTAYNAQFVLAVGDNFYWCGIQNTSDPQINIDYVQPYNFSSLQIPWYSTLGNHEYGYSVEAQIDYTKLSSTWYLPSRYYTKRIQMSVDNYMTLIVLDTSPCVKAYRSSDSSGWDPCSTEYPTCSQASTHDDFEGPCKFHENIISQDCNAQYLWFQNALLGVPKEDWLVIVGHHPIDEVNVKDFTSLLQQHGFSIYLNGHTHLLNQYQLDGSGAYLTTGAGSLVNTTDQSHGTTKAKKNGGNYSAQELQEFSGSNTTLGHSYQTVWTDVVAGFTLHYFNDDFTQLTTDFIKYTGETLHSFVVNRNGQIIGEN